VAEFFERHAIPVKIHIKEQPQVFERFGAHWTPTLVTFDADGKEVYRFEGFLPPDDFLAHLYLGKAKAAFARKDFAEAERAFLEIVDRHSRTTTAAEALYWAGVSRYKATGDASVLRKTAEEFRTRYADSDWAKKASVWKS
jgi:thioredoxin-like negative regulator of GroEL